MSTVAKVQFNVHEKVYGVTNFLNKAFKLEKDEALNVVNKFIQYEQQDLQWTVERKCNYIQNNWTRFKNWSNVVCK